MLEDIILSIMHFALSSVLLFYAARAYLRTKHPSMFYSLLGFAIIAIGHVLFDVVFFNNVTVWRLDEIFDDLGFIALIIGLKKS